MKQSGFLRGLGVFDAIAICVGCIIGSGIFRVPSSIATEVPYAGLILLVWLGGGLISLTGALCYAELAASHPRTGGDYIYVTEAYGRSIGFLFGWTRLFVERTGTLAAIAIVFSEYALYFFGLPEPFLKGLAIVTIVVLTAVNLRGIHYGKNVQNFFTALKILALILLVVVGLSAGKGDWQHFTPMFPATFSFDTLRSVGLSLVFVLFTFGGWCESTYVAGEMKNPERDLPWSIISGVFIVLGLYVLVNVAYLYYLPPTILQNSDRAAASMMEIIWGSWGGKMVACMVVISTFGALNGNILTGGRLLFAIADEHPLFKHMAHIHPSFHTPWIALMFNAGIAILMIITGTFEQILSFMTAVIWSMYLLSGSSLFVLRKKYPELKRPYRVWGYPMTPIIFLVSTFLFAGNIFLKNPMHVVLGVSVALAGLPCFWLSEQIRKKQHDAV